MYNIKLTEDQIDQIVRTELAVQYSTSDDPNIVDACEKLFSVYGDDPSSSSNVSMGDKVYLWDPVANDMAFNGEYPIVGEIKLVYSDISTGMETAIIESVIDGSILHIQDIKNLYKVGKKPEKTFDTISIV